MTVSVGAVAGAAAFGGCGSSSSNGPSSFYPADAGTDASLADAGTDGALSDTGAPGESDAAHAKLIFVNASANAPALRFCFGMGDPTVTVSQVAALPAQPDDDLASSANGYPYPGVFPGRGAPAPDLGIDLSLTSVAIFGVDAEKLRDQVRSQDAAQATCTQLLGASGTGGTLVLNQDYWYLGAIPKGTLTNGTSWLSAVLGCLPGPGGAAGPCVVGADGSTGPALSGGGGLWELDNSTVVPDGSIGVQFANASFAFEPAASVGDFSTSAGFYMPIDADAAASADGAGGGLSRTSLVAVDAGFGELQPASLAAVVGVTLDGRSGFFFSAQSTDGGGALVSEPLPVIGQLSWGVMPPEGGAFQYGHGYVFVLVGDPGLSGGPEAGKPSAELLAFPTDPPFGGP